MSLSQEVVRFLSRRQPRNEGSCLHHCSVLPALIIRFPNLDPIARLCQGETKCGLAHCWIEIGGQVVDLANKEMVFERSDYYVRSEMRENTIRRYSRSEVQRLGLVHGEWRFFELA